MMMSPSGSVASGAAAAAAASAPLLEARPFRPFRSSEEYLVAMREDLAEWLQTMYPHLVIDAENFMEKLETGVALCEHANAVKQQAYDYIERKQLRSSSRRGGDGPAPTCSGSTLVLAHARTLTHIADVKYFGTAKAGTFFSRDNVSNFIHWCRTALTIHECLLFETDDLILRKNEKHVILCLLEVARRGARFGMLAPVLIQMERQIDRELAADLLEGATVNDDDDDDYDDLNGGCSRAAVLMYGPMPQIITNDLKSLDEMVRDLVERCHCPTQFPMVRVSEGKYRIGDTKVLIFVRILRSHVMVRVGGGWDTLAHYLDKHDPCRCRSQHRQTTGVARFVPNAAHQQQRHGDHLHGAHVLYERVSPAPNVTAVSAPPIKTITDGSLTDQSDDTTSEVSDEGYRSLGVVIAPPPHQQKGPAPPDASSGVLLMDDNDDDLNDYGLRKTHFSRGIYQQQQPDGYGGGNNTWNGRQRAARPSLSTDCFTSKVTPPPPPPAQFQRGGPGRRSICAVSANTSPNRGGRLRHELLQTVQRTGAHVDDASMVRKVQALLRKYGSLNSLMMTDADVDDDDVVDSCQSNVVSPPPPPVANAAFQRALTFSRGSKRRDSRMRDVKRQTSRIPAPVSAHHEQRIV